MMRFGVVIQMTLLRHCQSEIILRIFGIGRLTKKSSNPFQVQNGVYLWYCARPSRPAAYVYVGESHGNSKGLRGRLDDEFRRIYHGFWAELFRTNKYLEETITVFGNREKYKPSKSYEAGIRNDFERRGGTHIVFCSEIAGNQDLVAIQNDLIQLYANPRGNVKDKRPNPIPEGQLMSEAKLIYGEFNKIIQQSKACSF